VQVGTHFVATSSYEAFKDYTVQGRWLDALWSGHKLSHQQYLQYACLGEAALFSFRRYIRVHIYWTLHGCMAISICRYIETFFERGLDTHAHTHIYIYKYIYIYIFETDLYKDMSFYIYLYLSMDIYIYTWTQGCGCQRLTLGSVIAIDLSIAVYRSPWIEALYGREEPMSG
jgi:hypothetical protein